MDITTTEVADYVVGGVMACDNSRFSAMIEEKIPFVLSVGALDMVNFGAKDTIPATFRNRKIYEHNEQVICLSFSCFFFWLIELLASVNLMDMSHRTLNCKLYL